MAILRRTKKPKIRSLADICNELPNMGNPEAPIMFVVDPPITSDLTKDCSVLSSGQFTFIRDYLKANGIKKKDVFFIAASKPITPEVWKRDKQLGEHLKIYKPVIDRVIQRAKPKLIVSAGKSASRQVFGKAVQITKIRGIPERLEHNKASIVLPILSASHVIRVPDLENTYKSDMETIGRLKKYNYSISKSVPTIAKNYKWVTDIDFILKKKPKLLAVDVETVGGAWFQKSSRVLSVQLCFKSGEAYMIPIDYKYNGVKLAPKIRKKLRRQLKQLLEDPTVKCTGHNLKYDWLMLNAKLNISIANYYHDTLLLVHAIDENMISKSLDDCVRVYVPEMSGFNDVLNNDPEHQDKTRMDLLSQDKALVYGCGDADASFRLTKNLSAILRQDKRAYNSYRSVTMPAIRAFCDIEQQGFTVNEKELIKFEKMLKQHQADEYKRLIRMIPMSIRSEFADTGVGLKLTRAELLRAVLFTHEDGLQLRPLVFTKTSTEENPIPSVSTKQHLPYFADNDFVVGIIDYIKNDKLLNTYVKGFYKYINGEKIRPSYLLHGTVTGRTSSKDPNGQNFPKRGKLAKQYRKIFVAPPGWTLVEADFSQIELRIAAIMANEPTMLEVYMNDGDIHVATAAGVMGITVEEFQRLPEDVQSMKRFQAKAINFGFIYGMWWRKFKIYAKTEYGIDFTDEEAANIREMFFETYPNLEEYHRVITEFAAQNGFVRSIDGRIRHLPSVFSKDKSISQQAIRQAINSPVQCFANQLGLMALARINAELPKDTIRVCGFIHDAIICIVRNDRAMWACKQIKRYMESNPLKDVFDFVPPIPIRADVAVGTSLAEMHELGKQWKNLSKSKDIKTAEDIYAYLDKLKNPEKVKVRRRVRKLKLSSK